MTKKLFMRFNLKDIIKTNNNTILFLIALFANIGGLSQTYTYGVNIFSFSDILYLNVIGTALNYILFSILYSFLSIIFNLKYKFRDYLIIVIYSCIPIFIYDTLIVSSYFLSSKNILFDYLSGSILISIIVYIWSLFLNIKYLSEYQKKLNIYQIIAIFIILVNIIYFFMALIIGIIIIIFLEFYRYIL